MTRVPLRIAVTLVLALSAAAARAAGSDDAQWPSLGDDAQWPNVKVDEAPINPKPAFIPPDEPVAQPVIRKPLAAPKSVYASKPVFAPETTSVDVTGSVDVTSSTAEWPNVKVDETPINPKPAFVAQEPAPRIASPKISTPKTSTAKSVFAPDTNALDVTGLTPIYKAPAALPEEPQPSAFAFQAGARYWYSFGNYRYAFSNNAVGNMGPAGWDRARFSVSGAIGSCAAAAPASPRLRHPITVNRFIALLLGGRFPSG